LAPHGIALVDGRVRSRLALVNGVGRGYGHPTPEGEAAGRLAAEHGLALDATYGAKALAALARRPAGAVQRVVFWHTFGVPAPAGEVLA
jgi:1-aminocyclopropane-1-carboxylate deaminase/D-cysteine desulfhydrase-like pyridoxal-dependent ACC family enzyme